MVGKTLRGSEVVSFSNQTQKSDGWVADTQEIDPRGASRSTSLRSGAARVDPEATYGGFLRCTALCAQAELGLAVLLRGNFGPTPVDGTFSARSNSDGDAANRSSPRVSLPSVIAARFAVPMAYFRLGVGGLVDEERDDFSSGWSEVSEQKSFTLILSSTSRSSMRR